jgi:hypothetical protein
VRRVVRLAIGAATVEAEVLHRGNPVWRASADHAGPDDLANAIAQLASAEGAPLSGRAVARVELLPPVVQMRTLAGLPPVRGRALAELVSFQRARFFRQNGKALVTDARWMARRKGEPTSARAAAVEEPWSESIVAACRAAGFELEAIRPAGTGVEAKLDLLPVSERAARRRIARTSFHRRSFAVLTAWLLLGAVALVKFEREQSRVRSRLEVLAEPAAAMARARAALREGSETISAITTSDGDRMVVLRVFATVAEALPDLTALEIDAAGAGNMTGAAQRTGVVVESLHARRAVTDARLVGAPTTEIASGRGWQPFAVEFGRRTR